jgi:hypothetical protein
MTRRSSAAQTTGYDWAAAFPPVLGGEIQAGSW